MKKDKQWALNIIEHHLKCEKDYEAKIVLNYAKSIINQIDESGAEAEVTPMWIVRKHTDKQFTLPWAYFVKFQPYFKKDKPFFWDGIYQRDEAHKFTDKAKAEAVATLIDGEVVEYDV